MKKNNLHSPLSVQVYLIAFGWLVFLTIIEVGAVYLNLPQQALIGLILSTALGKALLIALFFMHLKFEKPLVWLLPAVPLVLGIIFVAALFPDLVYHLTHLF